MRSLAGGESRDGDAMRLQLDSPVRCAGDVVGKVADVVIEPVTRRLTHVVVETEDKDARLVPLALVSVGADGRRGLALTCTEGELRALQSIRDWTGQSAETRCPTRIGVLSKSRTARTAG